MAVNASREHTFLGPLGADEVDGIVHHLLVNPTVERFVTAPPDHRPVRGIGATCFERDMTCHLGVGTGVRSSRYATGGTR